MSAFGEAAQASDMPLRRLSLTRRARLRSATRKLMGIAVTYATFRLTSSGLHHLFTHPCDSVIRVERVTTFFRRSEKMRRTGLAAIALAAALAVACNGKSQDKANTGTPAGNDAGAVGTSGKVPAADRDLARDSAAVNMAEIDLGTLAKDKAADPDTKKFAQMVI